MFRFRKNPVSPQADGDARPKRRRMIGTIITLFYVMGVLSAINAVMSARTAQGSIAWAVSLVSFPMVAVPAYWVLGRSKFNGYVTERREWDVHTDSVDGWDAAMAERFLFRDYTMPAAAHAAQRLAKLPYLSGNSVDLLIDGDATFASIIEGIESATDYVLFQFYIIKDDEIGRLMQATLIEAARRGVRVYFLYDEIGSHALPTAYLTELRAAGIEVYNFHTRQGPWNRFQINFRNHRKVVVTDGKAAWIGGLNVGDEYLGRDPEFGAWRDTHIRIEGPAALGTQLSFLEDWTWATGNVPELTWTPTAARNGANAPVLIVPSGPADQFETAALMFTHAINSATERIWIASPYFVPDAGVMTALQLAGLRGVDVRILIPDRPDHLLVYLAAFSYFDAALAAGVTFHRYTAGFLHQKVVLVDEVVASVGTTNLDNRSLRLNFEITALVADSTFVDQVARMLEDDFASAKLVGPGEYSDRPFWFRLAVRLARLTSPLL